MDLPYHAISDAEAEELAVDLAAVFWAIGDKEKATVVSNSHKPANSPARLYGGDFELSDDG